MGDRLGSWSPRDTQRFLGFMDGLLVQALGADACSLAVVDPHRERLIVLSTLQLEPREKATLDCHVSLAAWVARRGKAACILDSLADRRLASCGARAQISLMAAPLIADDKVAAILSVSSRSPFYFDRRALQRLKALGSVLSSFMGQGYLRDRWTTTPHLDPRRRKSRTIVFPLETFGQVVHELRGQITNIKGFVDILASGKAGHLGKRQRDFLAMTQTSVSAVLRLLEDLTDLLLHRGGALEFDRASVDLVKIVREVGEQWAPLAQQKGIIVSQRLPSEPVTVLADTVRLNQLLSNLMDNALKFSPRGARVDLTLQRQGEEALISVTNSGPDIPPSEQGKIFRPFYQIGPRPGVRGGSGLGLAIAKVVVERHGGSIWVESQPDQETTFYVRLPLAEAPGPSSQG
jgi:signal transduction histidine kinase